MKTTFKEYLHEQLELKESSISRVLSHFKNDEIPVGIITAFRNKFTYKENVSRNKELANKIKSSGYGYIFVKGGWIESQDDDTKVPVEEDSILVIGNPNDGDKLKTLLRDSAKKYDQDGALYKNAGTNTVEILGKSQSDDFEIGSNITIKSLEQGYTRLYKQKGNRTFSFTESVEDNRSQITSLKQYYSEKNLLESSLSRTQKTHD